MVIPVLQTRDRCRERKLYGLSDADALTLIPMMGSVHPAASTVHCMIIIAYGDDPKLLHAAQ